MPVAMELEEAGACWGVATGLSSLELILTLTCLAMLATLAAIFGVDFNGKLSGL